MNNSFSAILLILLGLGTAPFGSRYKGVCFFSKESICTFRVNDVVAVGPESFYATNWFYSRTKRMQQLETLVAQLDWSNLVFYDNGQSKTAASGFMMANGVNISPDKK